MHWSLRLRYVEMSVCFRNVRVFGGQKDENNRSKFASLIIKRTNKFFNAKMIDVHMHNIYWSNHQCCAASAA